MFYSFWSHFSRLIIFDITLLSGLTSLAAPEPKAPPNAATTTPLNNCLTSLWPDQVLNKVQITYLIRSDLVQKSKTKYLNSVDLMIGDLERFYGAKTGLTTALVEEFLYELFAVDHAFDPYSYEVASSMINALHNKAHDHAERTAMYSKLSQITATLFQPQILEPTQNYDRFNLVMTLLNYLKLKPVTLEQLLYGLVAQTKFYGPHTAKRIMIQLDKEIYLPAMDAVLKEGVVILTANARERSQLLEHLVEYSVYRSIYIQQLTNEIVYWSMSNSAPVTAHEIHKFYSFDTFNPEENILH